MFRPFAPCPSPPPIRFSLSRSSVLLVSFFGPPCLVLRSSSLPLLFSSLPCSFLPCSLCHRARGVTLGSPFLYSSFCSPFLFSLPLCPRVFPRVSLPPCPRVSPSGLLTAVPFGLPSVLSATVPEGLPSGLPASILPSALPLCFLCHCARGFSLGSARSLSLEELRLLPCHLAQQQVCQSACAQSEPLVGEPLLAQHLLHYCIINQRVAHRV